MRVQYSTPVCFVSRLPEDPLPAVKSTTMVSNGCSQRRVYRLCATTDVCTMHYVSVDNHSASVTGAPKFGSFPQLASQISASITGAVYHGTVTWKWKSHHRARSGPFMRCVVHLLLSRFLWTKRTSYGPTACGHAGLERLAGVCPLHGAVYGHEMLTLDQHSKHQLNTPLPMST